MLFLLGYVNWCIH